MPRSRKLLDSGEPAAEDDVAAALISSIFSTTIFGGSVHWGSSLAGPLSGRS